MTAFSSIARALALVLMLAGAGRLSAQATDVSRPRAAEAGNRIMVMLRIQPPHFRPGTGYGGSYGDGEGRSARWRLARRVAARQGAAIVDEWPMSLLGVDCYVMSLPPGKSVDTAIAQLASDPAVSWAEPLHIFHGKGDDAEPVYQDPLYPLQPAAREWRLARLHRIATGHNVRVAIIDSMVDVHQPDLTGQIDTVRNFVSDAPAAAEAHGTAVAGIIVAKPNNGVGIVGIAPQARLMALRACWQERQGTATATLCDDLSMAKALEFAIVHGAQIINMSLSGPDALLLGRLIDTAVGRGTAVVAAYDTSLAGGGFPASHPGVIAVAAEGPEPVGAGVLEAPGVDVPTTEPGAKWQLVSGSSYAAAHVSGLLALVRERTAFTTPTAHMVLARDDHSVDACATVLHSPQACTCSCLRPDEVSSTIASK